MAIGPQSELGAAVSAPPAPGANGPGGKNGGAGSTPGAASATTSGSTTGISDVQRAFMLGSSVAELAGRIRMAVDDPIGAVLDSPRPVTSGVGASGAAAIPAQTGTQTTDSSFLLASTCRVTFSRIASLHQSLLPTSTTARTWFDPGGKTPAYLYPSGPDDYTGIGIAGADAAGQPIFESFPLFDASRRALNCLTLLYLDSTATLVPDVLVSHQQALIRAVLGPPAQPGAPPSAGPPAQSPGAAVPAPIMTVNPIATTDADRKAAVAALTRQTLLFLGAWDGYLRESFFTGELTAQDEAKLVAYEAGQTIGSLSWNLASQPIPAATSPAPPAAGAPGTGPVAPTLAAPLPGGPTAPSVAAPAPSSPAAPPAGPGPASGPAAPSGATAPAGSLAAASGAIPATAASPAAPATPPAPPVAPTPAAPGASAPGSLVNAWQDAFDDHRIGLLQHQIAVVGKARDDDFAARTGQQQAVDESLFSTPDGTLPSRALQSVSRSLDFWQHAIAWLSDETNVPPSSITSEFWQDLRHAMFEQTAAWQALIVGQVDLHTYTPGSVIQQILQEVITQFVNLAGTEGVLKTAEQVEGEVSRAIQAAEEPIKQTIDDLGKTARQEVFSFARGNWFILLPLVLVGVLGIGLGFGLLTSTGAMASPGGIAGVPGLLALVFGGFGLFHSQQQAGASVRVLDTQQGASQVQLTGAMASVKQDLPKAITTASASSSAPDGSMLARVGAAFGSEASSVLKAFDDGFQRIQKDLADLGYAVAVSAPLLELLIRSPVITIIDREYDFLDKIIWSQADRKAEVMRVAFAAFGPIGLFALARAKSAQTGTSAGSA